VIGGDSGILTILKSPYPREVEEPDVYDSIRVHAEGGSSDPNEQQPTFAVNSNHHTVHVPGYIHCIFHYRLHLRKVI
jgi:hypothetical protein